MTTRELARTILLDILRIAGIAAAASIGTNLYLAKIAMDIRAKHVPADEDGIHVAELDEMNYRRTLWDHRPLIDLWQMGRGYAAKLEAHRLHTTRDIARYSIGRPTDYHNEELLYKLFGVNTEVLIDHAWGWEPYTTANMKVYRPEHKSIVSDQVLQCPYDSDKARLVVQKITNTLALELVDEGLMTTDRYGRKTPKHAMGAESFPPYTSSTNDLQRAAAELYNRIVGRNLLVRRLSISASKLLDEGGGTEGARDGTAGPVHRLCREGEAGIDGSGRSRSGAEAPGGHAGRQEALRQERHPQTVEFGREGHRQGA